MDWQSRPVFISSTFADMQAERDYLRTRVFPELEERLKARRRHLEWVDLRIGVSIGAFDDAAKRELQILKVCLAEVRRCRPFLIVLLGDRYGWIPPAGRSADAAGEEGFDGDIEGCSVTHLEISYGILADPQQSLRSFFYFRDPLPYAEMRPELAALYSESHAPDAGAAARAARLSALKQDITAKLPDRVSRYAAKWSPEGEAVVDLEAWGRSVVEDLWSELSSECPAVQTSQATWYDTEQDALDDHAEDRARNFVGREAILSQLVDAAMSRTGSFATCLTGGPGTGKSAVFAALYRKLRKEAAASTGAGRPLILAHAAAASARSPSVEDMLRRWVHDLETALGTASQLSDAAGLVAVESLFHELLVRTARDRRVVLLIDALDQFQQTTEVRFLSWIPQVWPENVRLIATSIPGESTAALAERGGNLLTLPPIDKAEARAIAESICAGYHRVFEPGVIDALLDKKNGGIPAWSAPLWMVLAVEDLNLVDGDDLVRASDRYHGTPAERLTSLLMDMVADLPTEIPALYERSFDRAESIFGQRLGRAFMKTLAISRNGWRELDFRAILPEASGEPWDELQFASLRRFFRGQIKRRGKFDLWDFGHAQMRAAVSSRQLEGISEKQLHALAARHVVSLASDDPMREHETMMHFLHAEDWQGAAMFYGTPHLARIRLEGGIRVRSDEGGQSLTISELNGANRVFAEAIFAPRQGGSPGLDQILRVLQSAPNAAIAGIVAERLVSLEATLADRLSLADRTRVLSAICEALERSVEADPSNRDRNHGLGLALDAVGHLVKAQGNLSAALDRYRASQRLFERLVRTNPGDTKAQESFAVEADHVGDALSSLGQRSAALAEHQRAHRIFSDLLTKEPSASLQSASAVTMTKIAEILAEQQDTGGALELLENAHKLLGDLGQHKPGDTDVQRETAFVHDRRGQVLAAQGDLLGALEAKRAALELRTRLARTDPSNPTWQHELSTAYAAIGELLTAQGSYKGALEAHHASFAIMQRLVDANPGNATWQRVLSISHEKIGDVLAAEGRLDEALLSYEASLAIAKRLAESDSGSAHWENDVFTSLVKIAGVQVTAGKLASALENYQNGRDHANRLVEREPLNIKYQRDRILTYAFMGKVLTDLGKLSTAKEHFREAALLAGHMSIDDLQSALYVAELPKVLGELALAFRNSDERLAGLETYRAANAIYARLVAKHPDQFQGYLAFSLANEGLLLAELDRRKEARDSFHRARSIVQTLLASEPQNPNWANFLAGLNANLAALA